MAQESRRRRRSTSEITRNCSREGGTRAYAPTSIHDISDDLLELVLLHIGSPVSLVRAAATCKLWHRVIAGAGFRRRYRSVHAPHVLGHCHMRHRFGESFIFIPYPEPPGEAAVDIGDRVSLSFLPSRIFHKGNLELNDSRGGLLAFVQSPSVVVCDPWTKQYKELYPPSPPYCVSLHRAAFLLDADADMSNFRLLFVNLVRFYYDDSHVVEARVFSSRDNEWSLLSRAATGDLIPGANKDARLVFVGRAGGLLGWSTEGNNNAVLLLDESTGFSSFTLPEAVAGINGNLSRRNLRIVGVDAGVLRLVRVVRDDLEVLRYVRGSGACVVERRVGLSQLTGLEAQLDQWWSFRETAEATGPVRFGLSPDHKHMWMFSIDIANMKVGCTQEMNPNRYFHRVFPYELPWPRIMKACM